MRVTIESTEQIVEIVPPGEAQGAVPARVWIGKTESGIPVQVLVTRVAVDKDQPPEVIAQFERELQETPAPRPDVMAWPLRMIL